MWWTLVVNVMDWRCGALGFVRNELASMNVNVNVSVKLQVRKSEVRSAVSILRSSGGELRPVIG